MLVTAAAWMQASLIIEASLAASTVIDTHKNALRAKLKGVKSRVTELSSRCQPAELKLARGAYDRDETAAVATKVAEAMAEWDVKYPYAEQLQKRGAQPQQTGLAPSPALTLPLQPPSQLTPQPRRVSSRDYVQPAAEPQSVPQLSLVMRSTSTDSAGSRAGSRGSTSSRQPLREASHTKPNPQPQPEPEPEPALQLEVDAAAEASQPVPAEEDDDDDALLNGDDLLLPSAVDDEGLLVITVNENGDDDAKAQAREEVERTAVAAARTARGANRDWVQECADSLKAASTAAKQLKANANDRSLLLESTIAWMRTERLIEGGLASKGVTDRYKTALRQKLGAVQKKVVELSPQLQAQELEQATAEYELSEVDAVGLEVASVMDVWEAEWAAQQLLIAAEDDDDDDDHALLNGDDLLLPSAVDDEGLDGLENNSDLMSLVQQLPVAKPLDDSVDKKVAARKDAEETAWNDALAKRQQSRDYKKEAVEALKSATEAGKRSKGDPDNAALANEAALGWVTADRLIEAALQSSAVSEKHKAALGGKHDAVKKRARTLSPAVLSIAEAAYEAAERDSVAGDVASAMLAWDIEWAKQQSADTDSLDGLDDDLGGLSVDDDGLEDLAGSDLASFVEEDPDAGQAESPDTADAGAKVAARKDAEETAWNDALAKRQQSRDYKKEAVEALKSATEAGKRSKGDPDNAALANEAALGWVTADRLIEAALQSSAVSEKHKAALGGKHDAVKKRARTLSPAVLSIAEAAYEAAERDSVAGDVASAMLAWDAQQSGDSADSLDGLGDDVDTAAPAAAAPVPAPAPVMKQLSDGGGAAEAQVAEAEAAVAKQKAKDEAAAAAKKKDDEDKAAAAKAKASEEEAAAEVKKKEEQVAKEKAEKEAAEKAAKEKEEVEAKAAAPPSEPERPLRAEPAPEAEAPAESAAEGEAEPAAAEAQVGEAAPEPDAAAEAEAVPEAEPEAGGDDGGEAEEGGPFFSLAELQSGVPPGVDKMRKHDFLSPGEFQKVFGMSMDGFLGLPKWKQNTLKKKMQLF